MKMTEDEYRAYLERTSRRGQLAEKAQSLKERIAQNESRTKAIEERVLFLQRKRRKQSRALDKLAKISAMMEDTQRTIEAMTVLQLNEITKYRQPPEIIQKALEAILLLVKGKRLSWDKIRSEVTNGTFIKSVLSFNIGQAAMESVEAVKKEFIQTELWDLKRLQRASRAMGPLGNWLQCQIEFIEFSRTHMEGREVMKVNSEIIELEAEKEAVLEAIENDNIEVVRIEEEIERIDNELSDSEFVGRMRATSGQSVVQKRVSAVGGLLVDGDKISQKLNLISNDPNIVVREEEENRRWDLSDTICYFALAKDQWTELSPTLRDRRWSSKVADRMTQTEDLSDELALMTQRLSDDYHKARSELEDEKRRHQQMANEALQVMETERAKHEAEANRFAALNSEMESLDSQRAHLRDLEQKLIATLDNERQRMKMVEFENSQLKERLKRKTFEVASQTDIELINVYLTDYVNSSALNLKSSVSRAVQTDSLKRVLSTIDWPKSRLLQKSNYQHLLEDLVNSSPLNLSSFNDTQNILKAIEEPVLVKAKSEVPPTFFPPKPTVNVVAQLPPFDPRLPIKRTVNEESHLSKSSGMAASKIGVVFQDYFPKRLGPTSSPQVQAFLNRSQTPVKFVAPPLGFNVSEKLITYSPVQTVNVPISTRIIDQRPQTMISVVRSQTPNYKR